MKKISFLKLAKLAAEVASDKKGLDIVLLNIKKLTAVANYFLIVTAESTPQISAILESIREFISKNEGVLPIHTEGKRPSPWFVLDYGGLVIHIMMPEARNIYALERMWDEGRRVKLKL